MKNTLLIVNSKSGSAASVDEDELVAGLEAAGFEADWMIYIPDDNCPKRADVEAKQIEAIAILSGDGTIASVAAEMAGWSGEILVLPGGTMNLLSRRLHGEGSVAELLERLASSPAEAAPVSVIAAEGREVYTGLIAGPSTEWGKVRESLREFDVESLLEKVPEAWTATTEKETVGVEGREDRYPAIFVEPLEDGGLGVLAFKAEGIADMFAHGMAWLRRDFRDGPSDDLGEMDAVTIIDDDRQIGLLVDGEQDEGTSPFLCKAAMSSVNFIRIK